jgi:signal transduction histidine kinase
LKRPALPTTARIALLAIVLSLVGNAILIGFVRYATFAEHEGLAEALERSLWLALGLSILFGVASGWFIARYVNRRVRALARVADAVSAGDFARRAPVGAGGDAFDVLARRINAMLDRIEALMSELRLLTDSLAHDLRSPVQRLRARVETAVTTTDEEQRDVLLAGVVKEADALTRLLTTVLEIGRSEAGTARAQFVALDPGALVAEIAEMYEPLAEEKGVLLHAEAGPVSLVMGHRQLLAQALTNLVDNALSYGGGRPVTLFARIADGAFELGVADHGPGIAERDRGEARRRFGRLDAARNAPGAGLGLALVESIAHLHGGTLELADNVPGLRATLLLPL